MRIIAIALLASFCSATAQAQVLEGFESGNLNAYTSTTGATPPAFTSSAAYSGSLGLEFSGATSSWYYRTDITVDPGDHLHGRVRPDGSGRLYFGFASSASGCWSAVLAPNTSELILQLNSGYGYSDQSATPYTYTNGLWYLLEIDWAVNGMVVVNLYDDTGSTLLASTPPFQGPTTAGGIAFRGFSSPTIQFDEITKNLSAAPSFCTGSQASLGCPCGNLHNGANTESGCANSAGAAGGMLAVQGVPKLAASTLQLVASDLPPSTVGLYMQGTTLLNSGLGNFFGDGLLCAGGQVSNLEIVFTDAQGGSQTGVNIQNAGGVTAPGVRIYQVQYRDHTGGPCGSGFNLTNAREVTWFL